MHAWTRTPQEAALLPLLLDVLVAAPLHGQGSWMPAARSLEERHSRAMAYDHARERMVLFGGDGALGSLADTWEWDGTSWRLLSPTGTPPSRVGHAMASDLARNGVVLFGGWSLSGVLGDTWEWDGTGWLERVSTTRP